MKNRYKLSIILLSCFFCTNFSFAQSIVIPDSISGWQQTWVAGLNGSQASYKNWSKGGVSSLSATGSSVLTLLYRENTFGYGFKMDLKYGQAKIKGEGVRKTDDVISLRNRFTYPLDEKSLLSLYVSAGFRTQFDKGYEYDATVAGGDSLISDFFAPAYFDESVGIAYTPSDFFMFEAGVGLKQTIVSDDNLSENYGLVPGDNFKNEAGLTTGINYKQQLAENILYESSLDTFTNFMISIAKTDVVWSNTLVGQINELVNATFQFELRYDDDFSSEIQLKQVLSAGISVNLY